MPMCSRRSAVFKLAVISGGAAIATPTLAQTGKAMTTPSGLQIIDTKARHRRLAQARADLRHALHRLAL